MINKAKYLTGVATIALGAGLTGAALADGSDTSNLYTSNLHKVDLTVAHAGAAFDGALSDVIVPLGGGISPFYGNISPFYGNISPFYGNISPFYGNISPFYGNINPFFGNISPFYGNISPFWGDINAFYGNISPFHGNIDPFWGNISPFYGNINPFWGNIAPFWGSLIPFWGDIYAFWGNISPFVDGTSDRYTELMGMLEDSYARTEETWGARIQAETGLDFWNGFAKKLYDKYEIDPSDASSLAKLSEPDRAAFFQDWYDNLMQFSGQDQVDYWMPMVNWRPSLTQDQGEGAGAVVGLLDARVPQGEMVEYVQFVGGYETFANPHGAAVASLIAAKHDGKGIMGIAPKTSLLNYNPFDETGTTNWDDVRSGLVTLAGHGAEIVNLSLGVPGWTFHQGWADILSDRDLDADFKDIVFVKAAGNEGVTQTQDVEWSKHIPADRLILVGSVGLDAEISAFSNTPGEACLTIKNQCREENKLKYRFLVAPGEYLLVSDNEGGVTRMSGTSFAAPLVTGALALIYDRWPWLKDHPEDAVQAILESAQDLGEKGVDPVYGWGLLDVEAAQSPLSFDELKIYLDKGRTSTALLKEALLSPSTLAAWEAEGAALVAFEKLHKKKRDFVVPLSSRLHGENYGSKFSDTKYQRHVQRRLMDWASGASLTDIRRVEADGGQLSGWTLSIAAVEQNPYADSYDPGLPFKQDFRLANPKTGAKVMFGFGDGAIALQDRAAFGFYSDYGASTGGVNPVLGFASGGAYGGTGIDLSKKASLTLGFTQHTDDHTAVRAETGQHVSTAAPGIEDYEAAAYMLGLDYQVSDRLGLSGSYTLLDEATGLLGVQGAGALSLSGGALTDAFTFGADLAITSSFSFAASATLAETRSAGFGNSALAVGTDGIQSTAFMVAGSKQGVFTKSDAMRLSLTQPLSITDGNLAYTSYQVIDRETGEIGLVTDNWSLESANPELNAEMLYARPLLQNRATLSLSGQIDLNAADAGALSAPFVLSSRLSFAF